MSLLRSSCVPESVNSFSFLLAAVLALYAPEIVLSQGFDRHVGRQCRGRSLRRAGPDGGRARWDVLESLARVVDHIPEPSQQTVRYWGFYSNAARGKRRKAAQTGDAAQAPPRQNDDEFTRRALRRRWSSSQNPPEPMASSSCRRGTAYTSA